MEQQQLQALPAAPFPAPPPFWKKFTAANVQRYQELTKDQHSQDETLPADLAFLRPPPPPGPQVETYTTFAIPQQVDVKPALPPRDQLLFDPDDPHINHAVLLTRLTKSLLLNFLELMTILSLDPTKHDEKMEDIRQLVLNVHAVVNMYRPHQAREGVREMLEEMLEDGQREIDECDRVKSKVETFLSGLAETETRTEGTENGHVNGASKPLDDKGRQLEESRRLWKLVHEIGESG